MRRPALLLAGVVVAACATAPTPAPPAGNDGAPTAEPEQFAKPADHDALSAAFDPEAPPEPERLEHNVPGEQSAEPDADPAKQRFAAEFASAQSALAGTEREPVMEALKTLTPLAEAAGPEARQQLFEAEARFRHAIKDDAGATRAADRWLKSCGPKHVDACRHRALSSMASGKGSGKERAAKVKEKDACVAQAEASPPSKPGCLSGARAFYEREGDSLMAQRAWLAQAAATPEEAKGWAAAEGACKQPRCMEQRRRALRGLAIAQLGAGDPQEAARAAFSEMKLAAEALPASQRPYARTALVERTCSALDSRDGPGACRKLERAQLGRYYFKDFSLSTEGGSGLPADRVKAVNEHYGPALQECLAAEADRMPAPSAERYKVRWIVLNDGRVDAVHIVNKNRDGGPLAQCLRGQFAV
ncbi:MAG TPA: hypothetical protein VH208_03090, partial [Myxococcaceae bacterium]|nr:hypothetical protein [Myxococcaceae bacterium]